MEGEFTLGIASFLELGEGGGVFSARAKRISRRLIYNLEAVQKHEGGLAYDAWGTEDTFGNVFVRAGDEFKEKYGEEY